MSNIAGMKQDFYDHTKSAIGNRLYPGKLPANPTLPAAAYTQISAPEDHPSHSQDVPGTVTMRLQVTTWATGYAQAIQAGEAIRVLAETFRGGDNSTVHLCYREDSHDAEDPDTGWTQFIQDFRISLYLD